MEFDQKREKIRKNAAGEKYEDPAFTMPALSFAPASVAGPHD